MSRLVGVGASALSFDQNGSCTPDRLAPTDPIHATATCNEIVSGTTNTNFTKLGPADQGSFFTFDFGGLAAGESKSFDIFYGAAPSEGEAIGGAHGSQRGGVRPWLRFQWARRSSEFR